MLFTRISRQSESSLLASRDEMRASKLLRELHAAEERLEARGRSFISPAVLFQDVRPRALAVACAPAKREGRDALHRRQQSGAGPFELLNNHPHVTHRSYG